MALSTRIAVDGEIGGIKVSVTPLKMEVSQPLIPDAAQFITLALQQIGPALAAALDKAGGASAIVAGGGLSLETLKSLDIDLGAVFSMLNPLASRDMMAILTKHARVVLSCTTVVCPDAKGELANYELGKPKDYAWVFDEHPEIWVQLVLFAGKVTFGRFFPSLGRDDAPTPTA